MEMQTANFKWWEIFQTNKLQEKKEKWMRKLLVKTGLRNDNQLKYENLIKILIQTIKNIRQLKFWTLYIDEIKESLLFLFVTMVNARYF